MLSWVMNLGFAASGVTDDDDKLIRDSTEFTGTDIVSATWTRTIVRVYEMVWTSLRWAFA